MKETTFPAFPPYLDIGCGPTPEKGWVGMDHETYGRPDIIKWDLTKTPWGLPDDYFEVVRASHVLEHIPPSTPDPLYAIVDEVWRILKPGGLFLVTVPWGWTYASRAHVQHYRDFLPEHFLYFTGENPTFHLTKHKWEPIWRHGWRRQVGSFDQVMAPHFLLMGKSRLSLTRHLAIRFPFLKPLLTPANELEVYLYKPL